MKLIGKKTLIITAATLAAGLLLTGCGAGATTATPADSNGTQLATGEATTAPTLTDAWTKATDGMTGVFGTLINPDGADIYLVAASTPVAASAELHETVMSGGALMMQEKDGGFLIPASGSFALQPGGDHIMLMGLSRALLPGEEIELTLTFSDGSTSSLMVPVRDFAGAIEEYAPGDHDKHQDHDDDDSHHD